MPKSYVLPILSLECCRERRMLPQQALLVYGSSDGRCMLQNKTICACEFTPPLYETTDKLPLSATYKGAYQALQLISKWEPACGPSCPGKRAHNNLDGNTQALQLMWQINWLVAYWTVVCKNAWQLWFLENKKAIIIKKLSLLVKYLVLPELNFML